MDEESQSYAGERVELRNLDELDIAFDERGLVPAVVQQAGSGELLMLAWMSRESLELTLGTGTSWFWSRSRQELWNKGATSGNVQKVRRVLVDCDADALLLEVDSPGPACHTGHRSCFFRAIAPMGASAWEGDDGRHDAGDSHPSDGED
ncbi:phosphoribosyl-AMP cyclohydrolase [Olsenella phocaeensis]|uniref:phosphoribosyl-AMP cyclohydrolase n=1 Tax=Olsenella phocaeensis TaxID=1852385 RepID=UPI003A933CCD